jgi:multidrug efflux pump subunit AcrA (membrane-fusion protein)
MSVSPHPSSLFDRNLTMRQKMTTSRRLSLGMLGLAAIAVSAFFLLGGGEARVEARAEPSRARPLGVASMRPRAQDGFEIRQSFTGRVTARRTSTLAFERLGRIAEILVDEGDGVAEGAVLARLDQRVLEISRRRVSASLDAARARLLELENGPRETEIRVARQSVLDLDAQLAWTRVKEQRRRGLLARQATAREEVEQARFEIESLSARRKAAQARLEELEEGTRAEQISAQLAVIAQLEAEREAIDLDLEKSVIHAPFSGSITARHRDEGTVISAGLPLLELIEGGRLEVRMGLPYDLASTFAVGEEVSLEDERGAIRARIRSLSPELDTATRSRVVILDIDADDVPRAIPGRILRWKLRRRVEEPGFWLPRTALSRSLRGLWSCFAVVERDGAHRAERRAVEILHDEDDRVFVRGTLRPEEQIVSEGVHRIVPGQRLKVEPPPH